MQWSLRWTGSCGQYAAYLSLETDKAGICNNLSDAMEHLIAAFKNRNHGCAPERIIIYRDGVSQGQFEQVVEKEVSLIKDGLALTGDMGKTKITFVVCTKRHSTRVVYERADGTVMNPCSGTRFHL